MTNPHRIIDLTMPFYDFMPVGNVWAWDVPFQTEPITTSESQGYELFMITMHSETGTRIMMRAMEDPTAERIDELNYADLVLRDTVVVDVNVGAEEEIMPEHLETGLANVVIQKGDAILVRTGWGDNERYYELGDDYTLQAPHFSVSGAQLLVDTAHQYDSNLVASDVPYYGRGEKHMLPEWASLPSWQRLPYPSITAKRYLAQYTQEKAYEDWDSPHVFTEGRVMFIGALVNCGAIQKSRVKMIVLPMKIKGAKGAPCSVLALEQQ